MLEKKEAREKIAQIFKSIANIKNVDKILDRYEEMLSEFLLENYESVLIKAGKFIEDFYQILDFFVRKSIALKPDLDKIRKRLEDAVLAKQIPASLKSLVADSLHLGYKFRNSRDGAHSVDFIANKIDAKYIIEISKWSIMEIIRTYSSLNINECISLINGLMEDPIPHIEKFDDAILVLHDLSASNEILTILTFSENNKMDEILLKNSIKNHSKSNISTSLKNLEIKRFVYRKDGICFLTKLGKKNIIELLKKKEN